MKQTDLSGQRKRIIILGGGFAGAYAAKSVSKTSEASKCETVLIDRNNYLLFYPLLVEAGVGSIEARHVVVPTRKFLHRETFKMAEVTGIDLSARSVSFRVIGAETIQRLHFDHLVIGLGSITRVPEITGLQEFGFMIKSLDDAIGLRDRAIRLLELANTIDDGAKRRDLLTCVTVGANYTGVEFAGEFHSFMLDASEAYPNVRKSEIGMVVIEYADRILSATTPKLANWCRETLEKRGITFHTGTSLSDVTSDYVITTKGERIATQTVVWAAGIAPNPLIGSVEGLPLNKHGYIDCNTDLSVKGLQGVWAIGDDATVLDPNGKPFAATAQTASRQGPLVMKNIDATLRGESTTEFNYKNLGAFAAIGRRQAAANVLGMQVTGFFGWAMYRATYLLKMPSLGMKIRLIADWTTEMVFKNEPVQLGVDRFRRERRRKI
jgi:NADH dehydrogenase